MKTKYFIIALVSAMLCLPNLMAQDTTAEGKRNHRPPFNTKITREQMKEMQVNQVLNTLMLDDATAAKFKPVYENYLKELSEARTYGMKKNEGTPKDKLKKGEPREPLTDAQIEQGIKNRFAQSRKMLDVREKYYDQFKKYLTPKQILKVYQLEKNNSQKIQKEFKKRMHDKGMMRPEWKKYDKKKNE